MKFCNICSRAMHQRTTGGAVSFECPCGNVLPGTPEDARVFGGINGEAEVVEMWRSVVNNAPNDRACLIVARDCKNCGRDYMTELRISNAEVVIHRCKCGHTERVNSGI